MVFARPLRLERAVAGAVLATAATELEVGRR